MLAVLRFSVMIVAVALSEPCAAQIGLPTDVHVDAIVEDAIGESVTILAHVDDGAGSSDLVIVCDNENHSVIVRNVTQSTQDLYPALPGFCDGLVESLREQLREMGR